MIPPATEGNGVTDYFIWTQGLTEEDWRDRYFQYLYRCAPITDKTATGQAKHIEKLLKHIDAEDVKKQHGSGGYKLMMTEYDPMKPAGKQYNLVRSHFFHILDPAFPPKVPYGEWLDDPRNTEWLWAKPALLSQSQPNGVAGAGLTGDNAVKMFEAAVQAVKTISPGTAQNETVSIAKFAMDAMQQAGKGNDQTALFTLIKELLTKPAGMDPMMQMMMQQMQAQNVELAAERAFNRELLLKREGAGGGGLKEVIGIVQTLKEAAGLFRGAAVRTGTDWGEVLERVAGKVVELGPTFAQMAMQNNGRPRSAPRAGVIETTATAAEAQPPKTQEEVSQMIAAISHQFGGMLDEVAPFIVDQFKKGMTGMDLRDWFVGEYGMKGYGMLRQMSPETLVGVLEHRRQNAPDHVRNLLSQLQPADKVLEFIKQFMSDAEAPDGDEDDDDEPAAETSKKGPTIVEPESKSFKDPNAQEVF